MSKPDEDIVADLRECAKDSRSSEGDYYADQYATAPEIFDRAADEIERLRKSVSELWKAVSDMKAAIETAGYVFRNTDSGPNLVR